MESAHSDAAKFRHLEVAARCTHNLFLTPAEHARFVDIAIGINPLRRTPLLSGQTRPAGIGPRTLAELIPIVGEDVVDMLLHGVRFIIRVQPNPTLRWAVHQPDDFPINLWDMRTYLCDILDDDEEWA